MHAMHVVILSVRKKEKLLNYTVKRIFLRRYQKTGRKIIEHWNIHMSQVSIVRLYHL